VRLRLFLLAMMLASEGLGLGRGLLRKSFLRLRSAKLGNKNKR